MSKILFIIPSLAKGGAERLVIDICNELKLRIGIEVKLIIFKDVNEYSFMTKDINIQVIKSYNIPSITGKSQIDVTELQDQIELFKPTIIHSHLFESELVLNAIKYNSCKYFVHFHDNMKQFNNLSLKTFKSKIAITDYYVKKKVLKGYLKRNTSFIAISTDSFNFIKKTIPITFAKNLLYNAINLNRFSTQNTSRDINRIVIIGSLVNKKGQDLAIETIKILHTRNISAHLDILGDGPDFEILQNLIDSHHLSNFITLHGNVDHPETFLSEASIYLHTAIYEPFGLVLIEAMALGLPVVCTDAKGNRDIIQEGINGFMIKDRNPNLIADKIELLIYDPKLWNSMSRNGVEISKKYDISLYVDKLLDIYQL